MVPHRSAKKPVGDHIGLAGLPQDFLFQPRPRSGLEILRTGGLGPPVPHGAPQMRHNVCLLDLEILNLEQLLYTPLVI